MATTPCDRNTDGDIMSRDTERTAEFVAIFSVHNRRIYAFVRALVHNRADSDEVFQETCAALWAKFDQFRPGSNFWSWACAVARFEALRFLRRDRLHSRLFSDAFYDVVERRAVESEGMLDALPDALADCYAKLDDRKRELVDRMYRPDGTPKKVAAELGQSPNSVYKALQRIHQTLFECIQERLKEPRER
jgi:RNA polymerase sigma-70 factor, ECF subfamily